MLDLLVVPARKAPVTRQLIAIKSHEGGHILNNEKLNRQLQPNVEGIKLSPFNIVVSLQVRQHIACAVGNWWNLE